MPEIAAAVGQPWRDGGDAQVASSQPWRDAGDVQSVGSAYARPAVGVGSVIIDTGLTAVNVIPEQASYLLANTLEMIDLRTGTTLPVESVTLSLPDGSALWTLNATGPKDLAWKLMVGEQPVTVEVRINSEPWQFVIEQVDQPSTFTSGKASARGRSITALASAPYWGAQPLIADAPTSAAQVCVVANTLTDLQLDWRLEDWLIDTGEWATVADPVEVVRRMAASVNAVVEASRSGMALKVSPRYPEMPRYWIDRKPEWEIPWAAIEQASTQRMQSPAYDGIVVTGQAKGDVLAARLVETAGNNQAPMVSDTNLTDEPALRQRAEAELGAAGMRALETRVLQVHSKVVERGNLVRCVEPLATWTGMVRSVNVEARHGWARQTLGIERDQVDFVLPETGDPFYPYVRWLFLGEGAPGSSTFKEEITGFMANGTVVLGSNVSHVAEPGVPLKGTAWMSFDGDRDTFEWPTLDWNIHSTPYTIDCYLKFQPNTADGSVYGLFSDDIDAGSSFWNYYCVITDTGQVGMGRRGSVSSSPASPGTLLVNGVYHCAWTGDGAGNHYIFINGVHVGSGTTEAYPTQNKGGTAMGAHNRNQFGFNRWYPGKIKAARCTVGVNRYPGTTTFKPPSALRNYQPL